ncbi:hypothetical protein AHA02nite_16110 [Alkalibacillus haloalkaliphilus]|uniref:Tyr recombinase domain-containing protein n=2 Tax=Alkalibacillus haloalkaliphilus TaxID=94136 RepID=A0A511W414_9BACI|nr:hypothetical protein AHA02nite_16110 [Alkalibacillus haloalkaliphilus]
MPSNLNQLVFYSGSSKYKVISNTSANKTLHKLLDEIGANRISVHGLRHTHASVLLYEGISVYYVSERLGHSTIETTMNHYAHLIKELCEKDEQQTIQVFESI